jgi:predicted nuclease with TOPRIM domain
MNLESIKKELNQTTERLDELTEMRDALNNNLQSLQGGFINGKTTLAELQTEQGKLTPLSGSIKALEAKQSELKNELESAQKAELKHDAIEQMKKLAAESELAFNSYLALRAEIETVFAESAQKLVDKNLAWREKQS